MNKRSVLLCFLAIVLLSISCTVNEKSIVGSTNYSKKNLNLTLSGRVNFSSFKTKYIEDEIIAKSSITISYPSDYFEENLRNDVIASTLSNDNASFLIKIPNSFNPIQNQIYIIDATKRNGGQGNENISLRTIVRWNGNTFDTISNYDDTTTELIISGTKIDINAKTTALAILAGYSIIIPHDTIGKINILNGVSSLPSSIIDETTTPPTNVSESTINRVYSYVQACLAKEKDPISSILFKNGEIFFDQDRNDKTTLVGCVNNKNCFDNSISSEKLTTVSKIIYLASQDQQGVFAICAGDSSFCPDGNALRILPTPIPTQFPVPTPTALPTLTPRYEKVYSITQFASILGSPTTMKLDSSGNLIVLCLNRNIIKISPNSSITLIAQTSFYPVDMTVTKNGDIYITEIKYNNIIQANNLSYYESVIEKIDKNGNKSFIRFDSEPNYNTSAIDFDTTSIYPNEKFYVHNKDKILKVNPNEIYGQNTEIILSSNLLSYNTSIGNLSGNLYFIDSFNSGATEIKMKKIDSSKNITDFATLNYDIYGQMSFDKNNNIFIVSKNKFLQKIDTSGNISNPYVRVDPSLLPDPLTIDNTIWQEPSSFNPNDIWNYVWYSNGIAIDTNDNIFVSTSFGKILKLTPSIIDINNNPVPDIGPPPIDG
ncbi:MAG: hypothetical protein AABZ74_10425 [Cyanobacteriota bacterium]